MKQTRSLRRAVLASLALAAFVWPALLSSAPGCTAGFAPISQLTGLRVLAVAADKPYAQPGDTVTLTMTYDDTYDRPPPVIVWLGGCINPAGGDYYDCYTQIATALAGVNLADPDLADLPPGLVGVGSTFSFTVPAGILAGASSGTEFVFFAACAGTLGPAPAQSSGLAGSFPVGCFDSAGNQLGADSFVPGYTEIYSFSDGRTNANPVFVGDGLLIDDTAVPPDGGLPPDGGTLLPVVSGCSIPEDTRLLTPGCGRADPFSACLAHDLTVDVAADVAEVDPTTTGANGQPLLEQVWVDYFADNGDINVPTMLVNDPVAGLQPASTYTAEWIGPPTAGPVNIWAVLHDSRGGETVIQKTLLVQLGDDGGAGGSPQ
jgi:hypothetical protein